MSMTNEQYLALSKLAYVDFSNVDLKDGGINISDADLDNAIKTNFKNDYHTNPIIQNVLPSMSHWKLIAHQSNTRSGFAGSAFQPPNEKTVFTF